MRCAVDLKADHPLHLAPERGLPAIDLELFRVECHDGQCGIGADPVIGGRVLGAQLQPALALVGPVGEAVDGEAQVGQDLVIDDIVQKYGVGVEGFLRQDDAIIECLVLADGDIPGFAERSL